MSRLKEYFNRTGGSYLRSKNVDMIISYLALRRWIGMLGIALPFVCVMGGLLLSGTPVQDSISSYYYTNMRDFFCGLLISVSLFLATYRGYERIDSIVSKVSGIAGFGIALFPCYHDFVPSRLVGVFQLSPESSDKIHLTCACIFFILLGINSFFLFTLSDQKAELRSPRKNLRNRIYHLCGLIIFASIVLLVLLRFILGSVILSEDRIILILEAVMLLAFGFSWLIKGKTLFRDN